MSNRIERHHTVGQTLRQRPNTGRMFLRHAPHCLGCALADICSLGYVAEVYSLRPEIWLEMLEKATTHSPQE